MQLRKYQIDSIQKVREEIISGKKKVILHAPTGSGKTICAADIIQSALGKKKKVLFLANRRELIFQAKERLQEGGIESSIIMAGEETDFTNDLQIASMQTYVRRINLDNPDKPWTHDADLIIADECHGSISPSWQKILKKYPEKVVIGLTATPCRGDGRGLGEYYDSIVSSVDIGELIKQEYLVPVKYFCPSKPDLDKIKITAGDYNKKELGKRVDTKKLVGDIFENWAKFGGARKTIIFAVNVKHSLHIKAKFEKHGINIAHVDAKTPADERKEILDRLKTGDIQVITNVGILCEGFDFPEASCIILARPTKSMGLYLQMAGRGLRPFKGKADMILLDHGGCVEEHGLVEWEREWSLDGKKKAWNKKSQKKEKQPVQCSFCHQVFAGANICPDCGSEIKTFGKDVTTLDAELKELKKTKATIGDKRIYLGMLKKYVSDKGFNPKMVNAKYKNVFGCWPHHSISDVAPIPPDEVFLNKMLADKIRYFKSKEVKSG